MKLDEIQARIDLVKDKCTSADVELSDFLNLLVFNAEFCEARLTKLDERTYKIEKRLNDFIEWMLLYIDDERAHWNHQLVASLYIAVQRDLDDSRKEERMK